MQLTICRQGGGGDALESGNEALYQVATGEGITWNGGEVQASDVGFRQGSCRIVLVITSAQFHAENDYDSDVPSAHSRFETINEINNIGASIASIVVNRTNANLVRDDLEGYAIDTGAVVPASVFSSGGLCATGISGATYTPLPSGDCPLVFDVNENGIGLSNAFVQAITSSCSF